MYISDIAILLSINKFKERSLIVKVFTRRYGIYTGFIRKTDKSKYYINPGSIIECRWNARLESHIGFLECDLITSSSILFTKKMNLYALNSILKVVLTSFEERVSYIDFFEEFRKYIIHLMEFDFSFLQYIKLEILILNTVGYNIDISKCIATEEIENLCYISPKSGNAVCKKAGLPYKSKLLDLPKFLQSDTEPSNTSDIMQALRITSHFLHKHIFKTNILRERSIFMKAMISK